jgi:diguanylate cyclase
VSEAEVPGRVGFGFMAALVEDAETWQALAAMGCELAQGYHLAPPIPPEEAAAWLQQHLNEPAASRSDPAR